MERKGAVVMIRHLGMIKSVDIHRVQSALKPVFDEDTESSEKTQLARTLMQVLAPLLNEIVISPPPAPNQAEHVGQKLKF